MDLAGESLLNTISLDLQKQTSVADVDVPVVCGGKAQQTNRQAKAALLRLFSCIAEDEVAWRKCQTV